MRRTFLIATNTLKEASRQKLMLLLALIALVLVASSNYFLKLDIGHERLKFVFDFTSGALGIIVTLLLRIPINIIFKAFTGISTLASLPVGGGIILVLISMLLTFIAGLIPAQVASKKDPVVALRTE